MGVASGAVTACRMAQGAGRPGRVRVRVCVRVWACACGRVCARACIVVVVIVIVVVVVVIVIVAIVVAIIVVKIKETTAINYRPCLLVEYHPNQCSQ